VYVIASVKHDTVHVGPEKSRLEILAESDSQDQLQRSRRASAVAWLG